LLQFVSVYLSFIYYLISVWKQSERSLARNESSEEELPPSVVTFLALPLQKKSGRGQVVRFTFMTPHYALRSTVVSLIIPVCTRVYPKVSGPSR
jgi:hypothetical protein